MGLRHIISGGAAMLMAAPAAAHAGFFLPNTFTADEDATVTVLASFSDRFPVPEIALVSGNFAMVGPDGERSEFDTVETFSAVTILEGKLEAPGLYRLTTGERLGRTGEVARHDGGYTRLGPDGEGEENLPDGADILTSQTATVSETFVTVGGAAQPSQLRTSGRLSLTLGGGEMPLVARQPLPVSASFDGAPLANAEIRLIGSHDYYASDADGLPVPADTDGKSGLPPLDPGIYVLLVRHIAETPEDAETDVRSYTTTLTFELTAPAGN